MSEAPRAFVSHATEDKQRFVIEFATRLRALGIDAWVDQWEIRAGDSLVDKVFTHGIQSASVFIVVLSKTSVAKNWVREELDAGVVKRIDGGAKLIPILLDDVEVPSPLRHLLYVSVPKLGLDGVVSAVRDAIFGNSSAPPLGRTPAFTRTLPRLMSDAVDDLVFSAIVDRQLDNPAQMIRGEALLPALSEHDIDVEQIQESLESLRDLGVIETLDTFGGTSFIQKVRGRHWLRAMAARGVDIETTRMDLLVHLANHQQTSGFSQTDPTTLEALVEDLWNSRHIEKPLWSMGGIAHVDVTVAGRRLARSR